MLFLLSSTAGANSNVLVEIRWLSSQDRTLWSPQIQQYGYLFHPTLNFGAGLKVRVHASKVNAVYAQFKTEWMPLYYFGFVNELLRKEMLEIPANEDVVVLGARMRIPFAGRRIIFTFEGGPLLRSGKLHPTSAIPFTFTGDIIEQFYYGLVSITWDRGTGSITASLQSRDQFDFYRIETPELEIVSRKKLGARIQWVLGGAYRVAGFFIGAPTLHSVRVYSGLSW